MKSSKNLLILLLGIAFMACTQQQNNVEIMKEKAPYQKKYTNADFYKDGKLDPEIALKSYLDMLEHYGVPYSDFVKKNLWITDFALGDFENVGMAGLFWVNDPDTNTSGMRYICCPDK
jgi:D-lyxose ketol-isomerase